MSHNTFLMYVPAFKPQGQQMIAEGIIQQGSVSPGETVQVVDMDRRSALAQVSDTRLSESRLTLTGLDDEWKVGWVVAPPDTLMFHKRIRADVTFTAGKGHKALPLVSGYEALPASNYETMHLKIYGATLRCTPQFPHPDLFDYLEAAPGETIKLNLILLTAVPARIGHEFQLLEGTHEVIASGIITDLLD